MPSILVMPHPSRAERSEDEEVHARSCCHAPKGMAPPQRKERSLHVQEARGSLRRTALPPKRHLAWEEAPVCKGERSGSERSAPCEEDQDLRAAVNSECPANRGFPRASLRPRLRKPTQSLSPAAPTSPRLRTSVESQLAAGSHENPCFAQLSDPIDAQYRTGAVQCRTRAAPKETVTAQSRPPQ